MGDIDVSYDVLRAKRRHEAELLSYPNVQSVGVGHRHVGGSNYGEEAIVVGVSKKVPLDDLDSDDVLPASIGDVTVDVQEVGEIVPEVLDHRGPQAIDRKGRHRPIPQGVSCGHPDVTAGSTGWVYQTGDGTVYIGSNNHVLADINNASVGDPALQPGTADGGGSGDQFGQLAHYVPIEASVDVDLALAEVTNAKVANSLAEVDAPITGVVDSLAVGDELVKSGRTTGVTRNTIQQLDASVNVNYGGDAGTVTITGCILTGDMSEGGDSGSPVAKEVNGELRAAGRLFAGSSSVTVHHHIDNELTHLTSQFDSIQLMTDEADSTPTAGVTLTLEQETPTEGNIEATVQDGSGAAIEGATVTISGAASGSGTTDADGVVTIPSVPIGSYTVDATKNGYLSDSASISDSDFQ